MKEGMNSLHLTSGEPCPALIPGSLRIYSMRFCPFAHRALLVAAAKGIKYDVVNINLSNKPEFLFEKNSDGLVPTIEMNDGKTLGESLIVADYIDEAYGTERSGGDALHCTLHPQDSFQKALDRVWVEKFNKIKTLDFQLYFDPNLGSDRIKELMQELNSQLGKFDNELKSRGTKFFGGSNRPGMLDLMIWPWMERLPSLELIYKNEASVLQQGRKQLPTLTQWQTDMIKDVGVQESYLSPEIHTEYRKMRRNGGKLDYDFLHHK